jgi:hypothetical protein
MVNACQQADGDEIEITEEMIAAGADELDRALDDHITSVYPTFDLLAATVFRRMAALSPGLCKLGTEKSQGLPPAP